MKVLDTGSKMWLDVECKGTVLDGILDQSCTVASLDRGDISTSSSFATNDSENENMIRISAESRKWRINQDDVKMIVGDRSSYLGEFGENYAGLDGTIRNPSFNGFSLSLWNLIDHTIEDRQQVPDNVMPLERMCYHVHQDEVRLR